MAEKLFDVLVAGEINPDLILSGDVQPEFGQVEKLVDSAVLAVGSSSVIFACGAARLGLRAAFVGVCGDDVFGRFMLEQMRAGGVNTDAVLVRPGGATGLTVILNRGADRAILTAPGLMSALRAEDVSDTLLAQARHLHVASYFLQDALRPGLPGLFRRARALGLSTSLDTNYDPSGQWLGFDSLLELTDVFLPNETEALSLTRQTDTAAAAERLGRKVRWLAVKRGAQGALAFADGHIAQAPALPMEVVDTVGAGDTFDAGFIYGFLNGWHVERSLRLACACGSLSTRLPGGTAAQPSLEEALRYV